jgi:hypothetical protein
MDNDAFGPGEPGRDPAKQQRAGSPENKERCPAGTQAALRGNIEKPLDEDDGIRNRPREQSYPVRWLRAHYAVSGALAAVIAAEFGWGGA